MTDRKNDDPEVGYPPSDSLKKKLTNAIYSGNLIRENVGGVSGESSLSISLGRRSLVSDSTLSAHK